MWAHSRPSLGTHGHGHRCQPGWPWVGRQAGRGVCQGHTEPVSALPRPDLVQGISDQDRGPVSGRGRRRAGCLLPAPACVTPLPGTRCQPRSRLTANIALWGPWGQVIAHGLQRVRAPALGHTPRPPLLADIPAGSQPFLPRVWEQAWAGAPSCLPSPGVGRGWHSGGVPESFPLPSPSLPPSQVGARGSQG